MHDEPRRENLAQLGARVSLIRPLPEVVRWQRDRAARLAVSVLGSGHHRANANTTTLTLAAERSQNRYYAAARRKGTGQDRAPDGSRVT